MWNEHHVADKENITTSPEHQAMKTYWGVGVKLHAFLISALDAGQWSASRFDRYVLDRRLSEPVWTWLGE
jgi:hypothetical protein